MNNLYKVYLALPLNKLYANGDIEKTAILFKKTEIDFIPNVGLNILLLNSESTVEKVVYDVEKNHFVCDLEAVSIEHKSEISYDRILGEYRNHDWFTN